MLDLILFDHWWNYPLLYLTGVWIITVGLMRYAPRECPGYTLELRDQYQPSRGKYVRRMYASECKARATHLHHVWLRENAWWIGWAWPFIPIVAIVVGPLIAFFMSMAVLGDADWIKEAREKKMEMLEYMGQEEAA